MSNPKNIFFLGKGGVGKSTSAAITSLYLAGKGFKVLLVSMDPAHNQSDIFEMKLSDNPVKVVQNLTAVEVDIKKWTDKYLKNIKDQINKSYSYLTAFNLENYFDVLKYSPGIEEYALLIAFNSIREKYKDTDYIVFDMPPTALTLKFLTLPDLSLIWLENLLKLRDKILKKKEIVSKIKFGKSEVETDKIRSKLIRQIEEYKELKNVFKDKDTTSLNLVMNPDKLSLSESHLIIEELKRSNITVDKIFLNKLKSGDDVSSFKKELRGYEMQLIPNAGKELTGLTALKEFMEKINDFVKF